MRFVRISLKNFRGIEAAAVDLGPGLNVVFGQNDLGKSTIAEAVRAALLLPSGSTEGRQFAPWHRGVTPVVELTFVDDDDRTWRVTKGFAGGRDGESTLAYSNDGRTFSIDARGRAVDQQLRQKLRWGVASPGGASGTRGMPQSFLAKALLSEQTEVGRILHASLAHDKSDCGEVRLKRALSALSQDDRVRAVLEKAQQERDRYFTPSGRHKSGRGSPFEGLKASLKEGRELKAKLEAEWGQAQTARSELAGLEARLQDAADRRDQLVEHVRGLEALAEQSRRHAVAVAACEQAKRDVAEIDEIERAVGELETTVSAADETLTAKKTEKGVAERLVEEARGKKADADQQLRAVESEGGANETMLEKARAEKRVSEIDRDLQLLAGRRANVRDAEATVAALEDAEKRLHALEKEIQLMRERAESSGTAVASAREDIERARQWKLLAQVDDLVADLARKSDAQTQAIEIEEQGRLTSVRLAETAAALETSKAPDRSVLKRVTALEQNRARVQSRMSAGLEAVLELLSTTPISTSCDDDDQLTHGGPARTVIEADRTISILIPDVAKIRIATGTAEQRAELRGIEARWDTEGAPVLEAAGVTNVRELESAVERREGLQRLLAETSAEQQRQREELDRLQQIALGREDLQARLELAEAAVAPIDRDAVLAAIHERHGGVDRGMLDDVHLHDILRELEAAHQGDREQLISLDANADLIRAELVELRQKKVRAEEEIGKSIGDEARAVEALVVDAQDALLAAKRRVAELDAVARTATQAAAATVQEAQLRLDRAVEALEVASKAHEGALSRGADLGATLREKRALLERTDRVAAEAAVAATTAALADAPAPATTPDETAVEQSRSELAEQQEELERLGHERENKRGALASTGGDVARARLEDAADALERADEDLKNAVLDADAAKLLVETLLEAQKSSSDHVGTQLAKPVEARFHRLTDGRYRDVQIDPDLRTGKVGVGGVACELGDLSVGTSEQLATILRLVIAEHLGAPIILDDHLVQSDRRRLRWFGDALRSAAAKTQVIVMTCRRDDYLSEPDWPPPGEPYADRAGGSLRAIDLERLVERWRPERDEQLGNQTTVR